ncbi:iron transporter [Micractinium conductrix]|uniref:Iron transporter n=1 Tax=Micractinium conductrix TaxID=554055 RepID=A0A2P6VCZ9_9CHLO|nr:iron transporter [Micractinium conductrix]|eukprot:PSC71980.1 iron transporter [Micractinium conductrix]
MAASPCCAPGSAQHHAASQLRHARQQLRVAALHCIRRRPVRVAAGDPGAPQQPGSQDGPTARSPPPQLGRASQWERFAGFVAAGDAKEAWLSISATVLQVTLPAALLAAALHDAAWGAAPPPAVAAAEAAAYGGAAVAAASEVWKVLEGFQG